MAFNRWYLSFGRDNNTSKFFGVIRANIIQTGSWLRRQIVVRSSVNTDGFIPLYGIAECALTQTKMSLDVCFHAHACFEICMALFNDYGCGDYAEVVSTTILYVSRRWQLPGSLVTHDLFLRTHV